METLSEILRILEVAFGIGLVIFVHELGHYAAALLSGVRVDTFSLGFGPRLLSWKPGPTVYQIALVPMGGFCRMAGEERRNDGLPPLPDELYAKSVEKRFFIYSGGVIANVLLALITFPILFHIGVPFLRPIVGEAEPGSPAWMARLPEGHEIVSVNGARVFDFLHVQTEVALGDTSSTVLLLRDPVDRSERTFELRPTNDEFLGAPSIGLSPALEVDHAGAITLEVEPGSPIQEAGVVDGERMVAVKGGLPGLALVDQLGLALQGGADLELVVRGDEGERLVRITPRRSDRSAPARIGVSPPRNRVRAVRQNRSIDELGLRADDRLLTVQGVPILRLGDLERTLSDSREPLEFVVRRERERVVLQGSPLEREQALALASDIALTQDVDTTAIVVNPGEPAALAGLRDGDILERIDGVPVKRWGDVTPLVGAAGRRTGPAEFLIERPTESGAPSTFLTLSVTPAVQPVFDYGITLRRAEYVYRADGMLDAIAVGTTCSWKFLEDSWVTLKRIVTGQVSSDNVGGIITIGAISYSLAGTGLAKLLFFLCMLSINLAFLNVLPVPVLDGGHLLFLIVEKIKGSPVSDRVLSYSQMVGVVLILSLMVYVTYNDLAKWVFAD